MTDFMNYKAVYRTAPATPGLLITKELFRIFLLATYNLCSCLMRLCQWLPGPIAGSSQPGGQLVTRGRPSTDSSQQRLQADDW